MATLPKFVGREVALEYVVGEYDAAPAAGATWLPVGAMRTKSLDIAQDTADATADDNQGDFRSMLATYKNLTVSGDGVSRRADGTLSNQTALFKHYVESPGGQPAVWVRLTYPDITIVAFMLITSMGRESPYDDVSTFSLELTTTESVAGVVVSDTPVVP